ncbi:MAG: hypothetical protein ABEI52_11035, partial [Halobacteriaceae archaeon]
TGERYEGGQSRELDVAIDEMPLYIRAGSIVPTTEPDLYISQEPPDQLKLLVVMHEGDASGEVYDEAREELKDVSVTRSETTIDISADLTPDRALEVIALEEVPSEVRCDGNALDRVESNPSAGEWTHEKESDRLQILLE